MNFYWIFLAFALLFTPVTTIIDSSVDDCLERREKDVIANKYFLSLKDELEEKFNLQIESSGWPSGNAGIHRIVFTTYYFKGVNSLDDIRELMVDIVVFIQSYLDVHPELISYIDDNAMILSKMAFYITFTNNPLYDGWVAANFVNGKIHYVYANHKLKMQVETFEEAKAKVEASRRGR